MHSTNIKDSTGKDDYDPRWNTCIAMKDGSSWKVEIPEYPHPERIWKDFYKITVCVGGPGTTVNTICVNGDKIIDAKSLDSQCHLASTNIDISDLPEDKIITIDQGGATGTHLCYVDISLIVRTPFGILPPCRNSSETYAGVAAYFARLIQPYDKAKSLAYRNSAEDAWTYANTHTTEQTRQQYSVPGVYTIIEHKSFFRLPYLAWASAELSLTTGNNTYRDHLAANMNEMKHWSYPARKWPYMISDSPHVDETLRQEMIDHFWDRDMKDISDNTKDISGNTLAGGYRVGMGDNTRCGWGAAQGGGQYGRALMMAWFLTEDQQYIDLACFNGDFHLGANPLSRCSLTGMGTRHPNRPEISWWLYERPWDDLSGRTVEGIGIYGIGPPLSSYPYDGVNKDTKWPRWYSWRDVWGEWAEIYSEFTISQTVGPQAAFYAMLYGYEKLNGELSRSPTPGTGRGLTAEYYDTNDLSGTPVVKNDPVVNFNWLKGEPIPGIDKETFSVRWSGKVQSLYSQGYTFELTCDDALNSPVMTACVCGWAGSSLLMNGTAVPEPEPSLVPGT